MTKAFDLQDLLARAKATGLPELEKVIVDAVDKVLLPWLQDSVALEAAANPIYAIGVPVLAALKVPIDAELASLLPGAAQP